MDAGHEVRRLEAADQRGKHQRDDDKVTLHKIGAAARTQVGASCRRPTKQSPGRPQQMEKESFARQLRPWAPGQYRSTRHPKINAPMTRLKAQRTSPFAPLGTTNTLAQSFKALGAVPAGCNSGQGPIQCSMWLRLTVLTWDSVVRISRSTSTRRLPGRSWT